MTTYTKTNLLSIATGVGYGLFCRLMFGLESTGKVMQLYRSRRRSKKSQALACHVCGAEADAEFEGEAWCAGCLHIKGSCCGE